MHAYWKCRLDGKGMNAHTTGHMPAKSCLDHAYLGRKSTAQARQETGRTSHLYSSKTLLKEGQTVKCYH